VPESGRASRWRDVSLRELAAIGPLLVMMVVIGVYPRPFLARIEPSIRQAIHRAATSTPASAPTSASGARP
jgi:NADH-quinone oxidoreductase subunit M